MIIHKDIHRNCW